MELLVSLISGAVGGNLAGGLLKNQNLGLLANTVAGVIGGGGVFHLLSLTGTDALAGLAGASGGGNGIDLGLLAAQAAAGGIGGAAVMLAVSTLRNLMTR